MSRVAGCLYCAEQMCCQRHTDPLPGFMSSTEAAKAAQLERDNVYVRHYEQLAKRHWTERNENKSFMEDT